MNLRNLGPLAGVFAIVGPLGACYVEPASQPSPQVMAPAPPPPQGDVVVEEPPPPPPQIEAPPPPPPSPELVWVPGAYAWSGGRYAWERGHYERPPRPYARHVPGRWHAAAHGRAWIGAHWE